MLNSTHQQGNGNQIHNEIPLHTSQNGKINNSENNRSWRRCERGTLLHCCWECKLVQPLWKTVWRFLKKLKIDLPYDPAIALLGIYPKDTNADLKGHMHSNIYNSAVNNSQIMERAQMSNDSWMNKEDGVCIYRMEYYSAMRRNEILPFAKTWMEWRVLCSVK